MTDSRVIAQCSFCFKPNTQVGTLVAGPGVFICDGCVALCSAVVKGKPTGGPRIAPWDSVDDLNTVLTNLRPISEAGRQVDRNLAAWVARGRSLGASWSQIGEALGIARQSAWERFSGVR